MVNYRRVKTFHRKDIENIVSGEGLKSDAKDVVDWLADSIEGRQTLSEMMDKDAFLLEDELINAENTLSPHRSEIIFSKIHKRISAKHTSFLVLRVAAILLPFILITGLTVLLSKQYDLFGKSEYAEIYVPKGETMQLLFPDGSLTHLNADTKITYPKKFGLFNRKITLEGEAYFQVASNKKRPFIVNTGETSVKVLGTSFNINAYKDNREIRVVLDEGIVVFATGGNEYKLNPGQKFIYDKEDKKLFVENLYDSENESLWRSNYVRLNDTPLSETLNILNRKFDAPFKVMDAKVFTYSFNLLTENKPLDYILNELEKIAPLKFIEVNDTINVKYLN